MTRTNRWILGLALVLPVANGSAMAADDEEKLEFPPLVPDEVITGEVPADAAVLNGQPAALPAAAAPAVVVPTAPVPAAVAQVPAAPAQVAAAPAAAPAQQGYYSGYQGYPGYQDYSGYQGYQGYQGYYPGYSSYPGYGYGYPYGYGQQGYPYGYGAPAPQRYYGYRQPSRNSGSSWPWGGTWTEGPWNNGKFKRGDWLGGGPSSWFKGGDFQDGFAEMWDDMINAPAEMGTMPGGWEFPTVSTPNPVDVGEELGRSAPEFVREVPNMIDIK
jgi:hypothetical protein